MMRALHFDCYAGISGDMIIGALIDLGVDFQSLSAQLATLGLSDYELRIDRVKRSGIAAAKFSVIVNETAQPARSLADIREIINSSSLSDKVKAGSISVFNRLAEAEARVHACSPDQVHFHEVGAVDSIIDAVGAMIAIEMLGVERFSSSPLRLGCGSVQTQHGLMPVPAPATAELLRGTPVYAGDIEGEFVTPTGAAIVTELCERFGPLPRMEILGAGYGAGSRDPKGFPNALRIILGSPAQDNAQTDGAIQGRESDEFESVTVIETNIDDMNPQAYGFVMERAFALGALDVFFIPAQMKKARPGVLLTVLCEEGKRDSIIEMLFAETTTLGIRQYEAKRRTLDREIETVETEYGSIRIKVARAGDRTLHFSPEYDDCARLAAATGTPVLEVQAAAAARYRERMKTKTKNGELEKK
jgi:pyridinium-3,5-bisthiocarboxylic acid mononucleotide nickel chelatase